ncbi:hypothetical protein [uncultured Zhongshania sp.]|uniref:hypothetical protein n=1 Tax=uncultured Zhongshania sp. TaxID=1642288 RepID=UPI0030DC9913|tara:strand:- start:5206 stop:5634 length:429 start_codon:yes stop_codon:yes gene_type:complete
MKLKNDFSKSVIAVSILAASLFTMSDRVLAQAELAGLLSLRTGPLAPLYAPIGDLGLLPPGLENGTALFLAGSDILLSGETPIDTLIGLGGPLKGQLIPIFDVLVDSPMTTVDYIVGGGTIISPGLTIIPQIPLLNTPLLGL